MSDVDEMDSGEGRRLAYDIREADAGLIAAAIGLGDTLKSFPECTEDERAAIEAMQSFFRRLPALPPPGFNAEMGFMIGPVEPSALTPVTRNWFVTVCKLELEIGSVYVDLRDCDGSYGDEFEFDWLLSPGVPNKNCACNLDLWLGQVADPRALVEPGYRLEIESSLWSGGCKR